jgi:AraC-like DNA-binding protein
MDLAIPPAERNKRICKDDSSSHPCQTRLEWDGEIDEKRAKELQLRPGLKLSILDFRPSADTVINFDIEDAQLIFGYFMVGAVESTIDRGLGEKRSFTANTGYCGISFLPHIRGSHKYPTRRSVSTIHIEMDPTLLNVMVEEELADMPPDFRAIVEGALDRHYYRFGSMTAPMQVALYQMLKCPYQGLTKRLFLESKTLELIALQLEQSVLKSKKDKMSSRLRPADIERIHEAKDIIVNNMQKPPSLMELARQAGLNDFKLKKGFRQVFGRTVFGFLHEYRMEQSRKLLEEGKINVKEVSYTVGYMNAHSFSDAFKKRYGIRPSNYQKGE